MESWLCDGWRNEKSAFECALTHVKRGEVRCPHVHLTHPRFHGMTVFVTPYPQVPPLADAEFEVGELGGLSSQRVAGVLIGYLGLLAEEYIRGMRFPPVRSAPYISGVGMRIFVLFSCVQGASEAGVSPYDLEEPFGIEVCMLLNWFTRSVLFDAFVARCRCVSVPF